MTGAHPLAAFHCEQSRCNSCLAACITIVRLRLGVLTAAEAESHERALYERSCASPRGIRLPDAAAELGRRHHYRDPDSLESLAIFRSDLESREWWHIVLLHPAPLLAAQATRKPAPISRHGALTSHGPLHAVVLAAVEDADLLYLDPWFPSDAQPGRISTLEFAAAWTGNFIPVKVA